MGKQLEMSLSLTCNYLSTACKVQISTILSFSQKGNLICSRGQRLKHSKYWKRDKAQNSQWQIYSIINEGDFMAQGINERKWGDSQKKRTYLLDQRKTESAEDSRLWKTLWNHCFKHTLSSFRMCQIFTSFIQKGYKALLTFRPKAKLLL